MRVKYSRGIILVLGLNFLLPALAAPANQSTVSPDGLEQVLAKVQQEIVTIANIVPSLQNQQATSKQQIKQLQDEILDLQKEIQQTQNNNIKQMQALQNQITELAARKK